MFKDHQNQIAFASLSYAIRHHAFCFSMSAYEFLEIFSGKTEILNGEVTKGIDQGHLSTFEPQNREVCYNFSHNEV